MVHWRWAIDKDKICFKEANWGIMALAVSAFLQKRATKTQGVGRHSKSEILNIIRRDFEAFSNFLGTVIAMNVFATFSSIQTYNINPKGNVKILIEKGFAIYHAGFFFHA